MTIACSFLPTALYGASAPDGFYLAPMRWLLLIAFVLAASAASVRAQIEDPLGHALRPEASFALTIPLNGPARTVELTPRQWAELGAVVLTGVGHLTASALDASGYYIPVVIGGWGGYVGYRAATEPDFLREVGFTAEGLGPAFRDASILAGAATIGMVVIGAANGTLRLDADMLPLLVLYPAWGLTQQFLVQGLVTRHLADAGLSPYAVTPISAVTFGSVHIPNWALTAATTALGTAYAGLYQRTPNLWPLGVYHGLLGAEFYVWVLGRNPWQEVVGTENATPDGD